MIRYALKCAGDHGFESWFQSADAYETLARAGMVACPACGSTEVEKALMAPGVQPARRKAQAPAPPKAPDQPGTTDRPLAQPASDLESKLAELRRHVEANSDYVGLEFASEARRMHAGDIPHRSIYGEAKPADAKKLIEDGVPVAPLPFVPKRKTN